MKKLLFILSVCLPIFLCAGTNCISDTIKISIVNDEIHIEADNLQELEELLKHDLNKLFKDLNIHINGMNDSTYKEINMEMILESDSLVHFRESSDQFDCDDTSDKIISISNMGIFIREKNSNKMEFQISDEGILIETEINNTSRINKNLVLNKLEMYAEELMNEKEDEEDSLTGTFIMYEAHIGFNNYLNDDGKIVSGTEYSLKSGLGSFAFAHYAKTRIFPNGPIFLKYGLALTSNNYKFANNYVLTQNNNETDLIEHSNELIKSKLSTLFIDAPLLLQLDFSSDKREENGFNIAIGPFVGYMVKAKTKIKYLDENNKSNKEKQKGEYNINKVRYGLQAQFGVMGFNFYGKYHLSTLFEKNTGPENLNTIDFGIIFDI